MSDVSGKMFARRGILTLTMGLACCTPSRAESSEVRLAPICCISPRRPIPLVVRRFAELFVTCEQGWARIFSAADGTYLGLAPLRVALTRNIFPKDDVVPLFFERKGYQSSLRILKVPAWYATKKDATLNQAKVFVSLLPSAGHLATDEDILPPPL